MKLYNGSDSILHCFICFIIATIVSATFAHTPTPVAVCYVSGVLVAMSAGLGKEYGDSLDEGNSWSWVDVFWDMVGALLGACFAFVKYLL